MLQSGLFQTCQACLFTISLVPAELLFFSAALQFLSPWIRVEGYPILLSVTQDSRGLIWKWSEWEQKLALFFILPALLIILPLQKARRTENPIYFFHFSWYDLPPRDSSLLYCNSQALLPLSSPFPLFLNYCVWQKKNQLFHSVFPRQLRFWKDRTWLTCYQPVLSTAAKEKSLKPTQEPEATRLPCHFTGGCTFS